jgi:hypothetical protein
MKLAKGSVVSVPAGSLVVVQRGTLWLTQNPDRSPVVSALRDSSFRVVTVDRWLAFA